MLTSSTNSVGLPQSSFKFNSESYFYSIPIFLTYNCNLPSEAIKDDIKLREELTNIKSQP